MTRDLDRQEQGAVCAESKPNQNQIRWFFKLVYYSQLGFDIRARYKNCTYSICIFSLSYPRQQPTVTTLVQPRQALLS